MSPVTKMHGRHGISGHTPIQPSLVGTASVAPNPISEEFVCETAEDQVLSVGQAGRHGIPIRSVTNLEEHRTWFGTLEEGHYMESEIGC
jgi:hypothetical protein